MAHKARRIIRAEDNRNVLVYEHRSDKDRDPISVYEGTGQHDALRSDPDYELVKGKESVRPKVSQKSDKVGQELADLLEISIEDLRQIAAQAGISSDLDELGDLEREVIVAELQKRNRVNDGTDDEDEQSDLADEDDDASDDDDDGQQAEDFEALTRPKLNARAKELGVTEPDKLANKGEVIAAIEKAQKG